MAKYHVLFNPLAANKSGKTNAEKIETLFTDSTFIYEDITAIDDISAHIHSIPDDETVVIAGGDGTINKFINNLGDAELKRDVYYYATGSGNDFLADVKDKANNGYILLNDYIKDLPTVTVNGKDYKFINGIGYGIDGYCCEVGDKQRLAKPDKAVNYASIAIKGLLFHYKPTNATVVVDGVKHEYKKVWLAPAMNGRFYGGGMMIAPNQDRLNPEKKISVSILFGSGKLKTLMVFPSIFKGEHIKHTEMCEILSGHEITVTFDKPTALQVDGETILGVTSYTAKSVAAPAATQSEAAATTTEA